MQVRETCLWTALVTPFTNGGDAVDYTALAALLKRQQDAKNGVLILGSTGESLALSDAEKQEIVRFTLAQKLTVPVMIGVPNLNLAQSLGWLAFCRGQGVSAYLAATPSYSKPGAEGQVAWFQQIFDAADAPIMLYNVPGRTGAALSPKVLGAVAKHKNFWAVKESSGGLDAYIDFTAAAPGVALYCGDDNLLPSATPLGACGLVSVASNMWPDACHDYAEACLAGSYRGQEWWQISKSLFTTTSPVPLKALMHRRGLIPAATVRLPLSLGDLAGFDALEAADQMVGEWQRSQKSARAGKAA